MEKKILVVWNGPNGPELAVQRESEFLAFACAVNRQQQTMVKCYDAETYQLVKRVLWVSNETK